MKRDSHSYFNKAFKESFRENSVGMVIMDTSGKFLEVNDSFCKMLSYTSDELVALDFPTITFPADLPDNLKKVELLLKGDISHFLAEKRYVRKNGEFVWARSNVTLIKDDHGKPEALLAIVQNIDDIKQSEEALRDAMRYRDEFLRYTSHELRTPMTSIKLTAQMVMKAMRSEADMNVLQKKIEDLVNITDLGINRINHLIENMLDISLIQAGQLVLNRKEIDLRNLINGVLETYSHDLQKARIHFLLTAPEQTRVSGDTHLLEKVFANLISNTILYAKGSELRIRITQLGNEAEVSYFNSGPVIPSEDQLRIFQRFEKLKSVANVNGPGLGLFIVKSIIEAHHGTIRLNPDSTGAEFVMRLNLI